MTLEELREKAYRQGAVDGELGYDMSEDRCQSVEHLVRVFTDELDDVDDFFADNHLNYDKLYDLIKESYDRGFVRFL